jgi:beta-1,4-mannosyl-glycoprotein beta-1,4-N-acetylglucosaminyltransferase
MTRRPLRIDTFPFNREFEMLEMRIEEMGEAVDFMVAVEADVTHQDAPKPFYLSDSIDRYAHFADKLIVVRATGLPTVEDDKDPWARELAQREYLIQGLQEIDRRVTLEESDIILHGDVDEICRAVAVRNVNPRDGKYVSLGQRMHTFHVDWLHPDPWFGTVAATLGDLVRLSPLPFQRLRNTRNSDLNTWLFDSGWHFSWMGNTDIWLDKLHSFCHPEIGERTLQGLQNGMYSREGFHVDGRRMKAVDVDDTWPRMIAERRCPEMWFRPRDTSSSLEVPS